MSDTWPYALVRLPNRDLHLLIREARRELCRRHAEAEAWKKRVSGAYSAMANFMAGVTWALACRSTLRASKGHTPVGGKRPQSGEMWHPREMLAAYRNNIKQMQWDPIMAESWGAIKGHLLAQSTRKDLPTDDAVDGMLSTMHLKATTFAVRMARQEALLVIDTDHLDSRRYRP